MGLNFQSRQTDTSLHLPRALKRPPPSRAIIAYPSVCPPDCHLSSPSCREGRRGMSVRALSVSLISRVLRIGRPTCNAKCTLRMSNNVSPLTRQARDYNAGPARIAPIAAWTSLDHSFFALQTVGLSLNLIWKAIVEEAVLPLLGSDSFYPGYSVPRKISTCALFAEKSHSPRSASRDFRRRRSTSANAKFFPRISLYRRSIGRSTAVRSFLASKRAINGY